MANEKTSRPSGDTTTPARDEAPGDDAPAGTPGTGEDVCPVCRGSGRQGETACRNCAGTGHVIQGIGGG